MTDKQDFEKLRREATPGPWVKDYGLTIGHIKAIINDGQRITPTVARYDVSSCDSEEQQANARFIASIHAIDDALIAAEARAAKLEKQLAVAMEYIAAIKKHHAYLGSTVLPSATYKMCEVAEKKIKEIDNG